MKRLGKGYEPMVKDRPAEYREEITKIREEYDAGSRRVPCITLQCIGYNEQFFQDILACRLPERSSIGKRKRKPTLRADSTATPSPTRPRIEKEST